MKKAYEKFCRFEQALAIFLLSLITILVFAAALTRTFGFPINWAQDVALIAFACFAAASTHPAAVPVAAAAGLIASFLLLAFAVVAPGARPTLSRVAGALQLVGLVGAFPLVIMCWELF